MKFSIVYFSAAGHTEKVVRHIAEQLGGVDRVVDLSDPFLKACDFSKDERVVVGCPVYGGRIPSIVAERLGKVSFDATRVVTLVTYGNRAYEDALLELNDVLLARGATPVASAAIVAQHSMAPSVAADRPTATDYQNLSVFSRFALQKFDEVHAVFDGCEYRLNAFCFADVVEYAAQRRGAKTEVGNTHAGLSDFVVNPNLLCL